ncbi:hypothetical protein ACFVR6_08160 [Microbacterium sp. NPDC058021]
MAALTAVSVAAPTVVDMLERMDTSASIQGGRITAEEGGRSGNWTRPVES